MKNNNFPQQQNSLNTSLNKNSSRIQNYNYMFYLYPEVPNLLSIQNIPYSYCPIGLTPTFPQSQYIDIFNNTQNALPLYYALGLNNLLQLSLLNYNQALPQNPQIIPNIPNTYNYPNMYQNNFLLNKKTTNPEHKIIENDNSNKIKKISVSNTNFNEEENNETSLEKPENKELFVIKSDLNVETNSEIKSFGEDLDKNMIKEENNNKENFEKNKDKNELSFSIAKEKINENKKEEIKEKKIKKKRTNYKELLYDPILEHIGREDKPNPNKNNEFEEMSSISENSKIYEKDNEDKKEEEYVTIIKEKNKIVGCDREKMQLLIDNREYQIVEKELSILIKEKDKLEGDLLKMPEHPRKLNDIRNKKEINDLIERIENDVSYVRSMLKRTNDYYIKKI